MPERRRVDRMTSVQGRTWKRSIRIDADRFESVSAAILASLDATPIRFTDLVQRVSKRLAGFEGSVTWYTLTVARELERRGRIVRSEKPVRYSTRAASRS